MTGRFLADRKNPVLDRKGQSHLSGTSEGENKGAMMGEGNKETSESRQERERIFKYRR
jgi:hypothetical protein